MKTKALIEKYFSLNENKTSVKNEVIAGLTTFMAGMYIIVVNPSILVHSGIPYSACLTATVIISALMSIAMGLYAKNPIMVAPGMGINAYFTYTVVIGMGASPETALGAVFWSGIIFIVLSVLNVRNMIIRAIPFSVRIGGAVGIGLFISLIGFHNSGFIALKPPFIGLGKFGLTTIIFLAGFFITLILVYKHVKSALILGIVITTLLAWAVNSWFGNATELHEGIGKFTSVTDIFSMPDFSWFFRMDILHSLRFSFIPVVFSLLFVDMFDSITTFVGIAEANDLKDADGEPQNMKRSMIVDAFATMLSGVAGTSPGTAYIESAAGIKQGGRTGLTAVVTGLLFLPFLFFAPLAGIIPSIATAPVLVFVGFFMASSLGQINWKNMDDALPAFITLILIPLTYSLTQGIIYGLLSYTIIRLIAGKYKELPITLYVINLFSLLMLAIEYGLLK